MFYRMFRIITDEAANLEDFFANLKDRVVCVFSNFPNLLTFSTFVVLL